RNRCEFPWPICQFVRPAEPGRLVSLPFGGHVETSCVRRGYGCHGRKEFNTAACKDTGCCEMRKSLAQPTVQDGPVRVDAPVAKEWPIPARLFALRRVA